MNREIAIHPETAIMDRGYKGDSFVGREPPVTPKPERRRRKTPPDAEGLFCRAGAETPPTVVLRDHGSRLQRGLFCRTGAACHAEA